MGSRRALRTGGQHRIITAVRWCLRRPAGAARGCVPPRAPKMPQDPDHLGDAALNFHAHLRHGNTPLSSLSSSRPRRRGCPVKLIRELSPLPWRVTQPRIWVVFEYIADRGVRQRIHCLFSFPFHAAGGSVDRRRRRKEPWAGSGDDGLRSFARAFTVGVAFARNIIRAPVPGLMLARRRTPAPSVPPRCSAPTSPPPWASPDCSG